MCVYVCVCVLIKHPEVLLNNERIKRMEIRITPCQKKNTPALSNQSQINWGVSIKTKDSCHHLHLPEIRETL